MASKAIRNDLYRGAWSVVEIDFRSYFTTIPHDKLMWQGSAGNRRPYADQRLFSTVDYCSFGYSACPLHDGSSGSMHFQVQECSHGQVPALKH
jgi:hypothetical protein